MTRLASLAVALPLLAVSARAECPDRDPLRRPHFGDTHVHTSFSFDAATLGVRNQPRDAYRFARGERIGLQPYDAEGRPLRTAQLDRPLDFAAVTDHAEMLGETEMFRTPGNPAYDSLVGRLVRRWPLLAYYLVNSRMLNTAKPKRYGFCGEGGRLCIEAGAGPWREIQAAAADHDAPCEFTTFVAYEWSGAPDSNMIHRNVIFRNASVPVRPASYVEEPSAEGLWRHLEEDCLRAGTGCDGLAIPHNSNLSGGVLFAVEPGLDAAAARRRAALEPLVEIMQHKGDSECRVVPLDGVGGEDELCDFEKLPFTSMANQPFPLLWKPTARLGYVREVLAEGLLQQQKIGANPYKLGILASTDSHMGTPGLVAERDFPGGAAGGDTSQVEIPVLPDAVVFNPGGLAAVWAEENTRDALFDAMRRREVYGTSGPRMRVRFFGGWGYDESLCGDPELAYQGYKGGVPMGGDLARPSGAGGAAAPSFAVSALRDPAATAAPLQRVQIVKLWVEAGEPRERVHDVAGAPDVGAGVDLATCEPRGAGHSELCSVWRDPDFDPAEPALWYARVVENPSCRWIQHACNAARVDCAHPPRGELSACCDAGVPKTVQERAWTSPIWWTP